MMGSHSGSAFSGRYMFRLTTLNDTKATLQSEKQRSQSFRRTTFSQSAKRQLRRQPTAPRSKKISRRNRSLTGSWNRGQVPEQSKVPVLPEVEVRLRRLEVHISHTHSNLMLPLKEDGVTAKHQSDDDKGSLLENSAVVTEVKPLDIVAPVLDSKSIPSLKSEVSSAAASIAGMMSVVSSSMDDTYCRSGSSASTMVSVTDSIPVGAEAMNMHIWLNQTCEDESPEVTGETESNQTVATIAMDSITTKDAELEEPLDLSQVVVRPKALRFLMKNQREEDTMEPHNNLVNTKLAQEVLPNLKLSSALTPSKEMQKELPEFHTSKQLTGNRISPQRLTGQDYPLPTFSPTYAVSPALARPNLFNASLAGTVTWPEESTSPRDYRIQANEVTSNQRSSPTQNMYGRIFQEEEVPEPDSTSQNAPEVNMGDLNRAPQSESQLVQHEWNSWQQQPSFWSVPFMIMPKLDGTDKYSHIDVPIHNYLHFLEHDSAGGNSQLIYGSDDDESRF